MSARLFDATEAVDLGLLARTVPEEALGEAVEFEVAPYLTCAPGAVAASKRLARSFGPPIDQATIDRTIRALVLQWETSEAEEGIRAFFAKEKPAWVTGTA